MFSRRLAGVAVLVFLNTESVSFAQGAAPGGDPVDVAQAGKQPASDSHQRMLDLLEKVKRQYKKDHPYLGDAGFEHDLAELAKLSKDDPKRFVRSYLVAKHLLRLGRTQEAIDHFEDSYRFLPRVRDRVSSIWADECILYLAVAYLRLGETQNCLHDHTTESCILPIRGGGIYRKQDATKTAVKHLKSLLKQNPDHLTARWLINLASMTLGKYPDGVPKRFVVPPEAFEPQGDLPQFVDIAPGLGLNTLSLSGGTIADDFDGDGFLDLVNSTWSPEGQLRYFRNNGDGTFSERTREGGLTGLYGGLNLNQADYDNDGDIDIFVLRGGWGLEGGRHPNSLLRNDGQGAFRDVTFEAGLGELHYPTQTAAWADYDNDGDLDLYIGNEDLPSQLFENDGQGKFADVAGRAGVTNDRYTKGVVWGDYNEDRFPDLYVSNLKGDNRLYRNNGDGTFTDAAHELGLTKPHLGFPAWFWDFNNDGALDLFAGSYDIGARHIAAEYLGLPVESEPGRLYQGDGNGGFRDVTVEQNLMRAAQPMGSNFGDIDHDGFPDFYLGTGYPNYEGLMPNLLFHNQRGKGFLDVTAAARVGHLQKGHGVAFADFDNDGDQDIFVELGGAYPGDRFWNALFENPGFGNHGIVVKLVGKQSNRWGIGARIRAEIIEAGHKRSIYKWVNSGGSFGASPLRQQIGLGKAAKIEILEVYWPTSDETRQFKDVPANQLIEITEGEEQYRQLPWKSVKFQTSPRVHTRPAPDRQNEAK